MLATVFAFVETERLKLVRSPILDTIVSKAFAPDCHCSSEVANVTFRLRRRELISVEIVTLGGRPVRRLAAHTFNSGMVSLNGTGAAAPVSRLKRRVQNQGASVDRPPDDPAAERDPAGSNGPDRLVHCFTACDCSGSEATGELSAQ
jgi:hypothetical protein